LQNKKKKSFPKEPDNLKLSYLQREKERTEQIKKKFDRVEVGPIVYHVSKYKKKRISRNTAYKRGRAFEYRVKKHFEKLGYYVVRKYASKGFEDLLAIKKAYVIGEDLGGKFVPKSDLYDTTCSEVLLIQCKNLKSEKPLSKREREGLKDLAAKTGATPLLAQNIKHKIQIAEI